MVLRQCQHRRLPCRQCPSQVGRRQLLSPLQEYHRLCPPGLFNLRLCGLRQYWYLPLNPRCNHNHCNSHPQACGTISPPCNPGPASVASRIPHYPYNTCNPNPSRCPSLRHCPRQIPSRPRTALTLAQAAASGAHPLVPVWA